MRAGLLEHDDSILVSRPSGKTERSVALSGEGAPGLHECGLMQLEGLSKVGNLEHSCAGSVLEFSEFELARKHWRLSQSALTGRTDLTAPEPYAVQTGTSCARATQSRKDGASGNAVRIV